MNVRTYNEASPMQRKQMGSAILDTCLNLGLEPIETFEGDEILFDKPLDKKGIVLRISTGVKEDPVCGGHAAAMQQGSVLISLVYLRSDGSPRCLGAPRKVRMINSVDGVVERVQARTQDMLQRAAEYDNGVNCCPSCGAPQYTAVKGAKRDKKTVHVCADSCFDRSIPNSFHLRVVEGEGLHKGKFGLFAVQPKVVDGTATPARVFMHSQVFDGDRLAAVQALQLMERYTSLGYVQESREWTEQT